VATFQGFIDYARQNPGKVNVSSAGNGTLPHITMELLMLREKFQVTNVPYRGAAPALADLVAGQVQAKLDNYTQSAQFIADRKLNLLAVTSAKRLKQFPDVPTVAEQLPGFEGYLWMGIVAPAATPDAVVHKLATAARRIARDPGALRQGGRRAGGQRSGRVCPANHQGDRAMARAREGYKDHGRVRYLAKNALVRASASGAAAGS
jgi:tripartite-type tricarboxylate transporter receptor subunit TctC